MLKLYNTLTRKKESFKPLKPKTATIYSCGPTVYNYAHIGNLRTYIFNDVLVRSLKFLGYKTLHAMNITDVDDKTIKAAQKSEIPLKKFTRDYEEIFFLDLKDLNVKKPSRVLRATENIKEMVKLINLLLKKQIAYKTSDGIYFNISKSKNYGKLALLNKQKSSKERITNDEYDKASKSDFALWKFKTKEDGENSWKAPFGEGRPGWHIECSAMSIKALGETIDIHTGASDLIFPHHTNEIAQSEAYTEKPFVKYWLHAGFLNMKNEKMSKSLGNILTLKSLKKKGNGFSGIDYRYLVLGTHYREQLLFSLKNMESAKNSRTKLTNLCQNLEDDKKTNLTYLKRFKEAIENDLNIPKALQIVWTLLKDKEAKGKFQTIKIFDQVLGLNLLKKEKLQIPKSVKDLIKQREKSRKEKDFQKADELRLKINSLGYQISDTEKGPEVKKM